MFAAPLVEMDQSGNITPLGVNDTLNEFFSILLIKFNSFAQKLDLSHEYYLLTNCLIEASKIAVSI